MKKYTVGILLLVLGIFSCGSEANTSVEMSADEVQKMEQEIEKIESEALELDKLQEELELKSNALDNAINDL